MKDLIYQGISKLSNSHLISEAKKTERGNSIIIEIIKFFIAVFVTQYCAGNIIAFFNGHNVIFFNVIGQPQVLFGIGLQSLGAIIFCYIYEKMLPKNLGIVKNGIIKDTAKGYIIGTILICSVAIFLSIINSVQFSINIKNVNLFYLFVLFLVYFFQAFGEEVMYRGYFMISSARKNNLILAIVVSSIVFSIHHYQSPGYGVIAFINLFLLGILLSILILKKNNIWISTGVHSAWNFMQGNIFGINVSGGPQSDTLTLLTSHQNWGSILYGGAMGFEGSIITSFILIASIILLIFKDNLLKKLKKFL